MSSSGSAAFADLSHPSILRMPSAASTLAGMDVLGRTLMFTSDGPLRGADAIRPLFRALIAEFGKPGARFTMKQQSFESEYGYILWAAETADNVYEIATDTFVVRDGKIVAQSFTAKIAPKG
jgi:hypothetical protein